MSTRTRVPVLTAAAALAATLLVAAPAAAEPRPGPGAGVVRVDSGWLRGAVADDHVTYSAVPYAAPPVGERRWRPPARPRPWAGVRDATAPGPLCPQRDFEGAAVGQEDCLYLDVTVPRTAGTGDRLPVLVWLAGGGFTSGGARDYDGARLATEGEMVVVTLNYRLGALGFLSSPALGTAGGNYGLMDQTAALRWVRRNAHRFGGDARNVTLAGQSAGARSVCAHLASPRSRGLFDRATTQSGACDNEVLTRSAARRFGTRATRELGCATAADVAACLRRRPPAALLGALHGVGSGVTDRVADRPWNPVAGTRMLPRQPRAALRDGTAARVPLLVGGTRDEMRGFVSKVSPLTAEKYAEHLTSAFGERAGAVLAEYPVAAYDTPALALARVLGDWGGSIGSCPALRTARAASAHQPVYAYEFAESTDVPVNGLPLGSFHGLDLPYLWDLRSANPYPELTPAQERLGDTMVAYWSAFARAGDPNGAGRPPWPRFAPGGTVIGLSTGSIAPTPYADDHRCRFWAGVA